MRSCRFDTGHIEVLRFDMAKAQGYMWAVASAEPNLDAIGFRAIGNSCPARKSGVCNARYLKNASV